MALYERQQFDFLLQTAVERYVQRIEERFRGPEQALIQLKSDPQGEGLWLDQFTEAIFEDFLLNNIEGACFVLRALGKRPMPESATDTSNGDQIASNNITIENHLVSLAMQLFAGLLLQKSIEVLEQHTGYQSV